MGARTGCRAACQKKDREEFVRFPGEHMDHLHLRSRHALPLTGGEHGADFQADFAGRAGLIGNRHPTTDRVGLWNPILR